MSRGYLTKFDFDDHELWDKLHCRDQSAFLESKTCEQLIAMTRQRGIRDEQVFSYGQKTHKKTYIAALRETYLMNIVSKLQAKHSSQDSLVHPDVFNEMKEKFEASTVENELFQEDILDLKTTNDALHRHVKQMEKKLEGFKRRTVEAHRPLETNEMEEAERMCNIMSVNLTEMAQQRDKESIKVEMLERQIEEITHAFALKTKRVNTLRTHIVELTELADFKATGRDKETSRLLDGLENGLEILNVLSRSLKRRRCE